MASRTIATVALARKEPSSLAGVGIAPSAGSFRRTASCFAMMAEIVFWILPIPRGIPPDYHMRNRIGRMEHKRIRLSMRKRIGSFQIDPLPIVPFRYKLSP